MIWWVFVAVYLVMLVVTMRGSAPRYIDSEIEKWRFYKSPSRMKELRMEGIVFSFMCGVIWWAYWPWRLVTGTSAMYLLAPKSNSEKEFELEESKKRIAELERELEVRTNKRPW